jgi:rubredoxin
MFFDENGVISLGAVSKEEDLTPTGRIIINGPPKDGRCDVCGRHMSELIPFGGAGDPLVGDFSGELLVKKFRPAGPYNKEAVKAWEEYEKEFPLKIISEQPIADGIRDVKFEKREDPLPWFIAKFGEDKGEELYWAGLAYDQVGASWECRDCAVLDLDEYFEKLKELREK